MSFNVEQQILEVDDLLAVFQTNVEQLKQSLATSQLPAGVLVLDALGFMPAILSVITEFQQTGWMQDPDPQVAAKVRHDLYGQFTKINFAIDAYSKINANLEPTIKTQLINVRELSSELYELLRSILTQT